jgi:hypothetical protein
MSIGAHEKWMQPPTAGCLGDFAAACWALVARARSPMCNSCKFDRRLRPGGIDYWIIECALNFALV